MLASLRERPSPSHSPTRGSVDPRIPRVETMAARAFSVRLAAIAVPVALARDAYAVVLPGGRFT